VSREAIDEHFVTEVAGWESRPRTGEQLSSEEQERLVALFEAQVLARHTDFALRELQRTGEGYYTIGSAGHESDAAVALALRPTDPALLHYRSAGFYVARAGQVPGTSPVVDVLAGALASTADGISGGRHKVFGSRPLNVVPQTSTIASHLPRAVGLASALGWLGNGAARTTFPRDAVVVCSFGDASINHSTATGALNALSYCVHRGLEMPILLVCEDNGLGISTPSPPGWVERRLRSLPGIDYVGASGTRTVQLLREADRAAATVRSERRPVIVHLRTVRYLGHAGSDAEIGYRTRSEIDADLADDPVLAAARALVEHGIASPSDVLERYESARSLVRSTAWRVPRRALGSAEAVRAPIAFRERSPYVEQQGAAERHDGERLTLAQSINATLADAMADDPDILVLGEDVGRKGGVYGVTKGLLRRFGSRRVFDTLLDEQTILGTALGTALAGYLPVPEIQYLAYLHNAEDQLRGEAATLPFFSSGQYRNGMVVRIAGLAYQKGFGGHFHNDNSLAVLTDVPGLVVAVPSGPGPAPRLLRRCLALARHEGRVCVFVEPIALYHERDVEDGDGALASSYAPPAPGVSDQGALRPRIVRGGSDVLVVTFGNAVRMSLRVAARFAREGVDCEVLDLQWLNPLPEDELVAAARCHHRVLVADETRRSGGVGQAVVTALVEGGFTGRLARVASADSFIPLGPAASHVLLAESDVESAIRRLLGS
jgi:2-oxoisovalerate dehydrogenase E1 component